MTSTYLHVNCVVGVACAEAFANKNIAAGITSRQILTTALLYITSACANLHEVPRSLISGAIVGSGRAGRICSWMAYISRSKATASTLKVCAVPSSPP